MKKLTTFNKYAVSGIAFAMASLLTPLGDVVAQTLPQLKVDFSFYRNKPAETQEPGFIEWYVPEAKADTLEVEGLDGIEFILSVPGDVENYVVRQAWNKTYIQNAEYKDKNGRLTFDGVSLDPKTSYGSMTLKIKGLPTGKHTIQTYHNCWDNPASTYAAPMKIKVNGVTVHDNVQPTFLQPVAANAGLVTTEFEIANDGDAVEIEFSTSEDKPGTPSDGQTKAFNAPLINGFELNTANIASFAKDPYPANGDMHVDGDSKTITLSWAAANENVKQHLLFVAKSEAELEAMTTPTAIYDYAQTTHTLNDVYSMDTYFWRVDEAGADDNVIKGHVWSFKPRQLAFRGAEGYGRFANGGRGGKVVYVTNLNARGEGSFYDAIKRGDGPRTVLFMVSGLIDIGTESVFADNDITVAGQSAPGKGISLKHCNIGLGNDNIWRHMRMRRGYTENRGNAMGVSGCDNTIADHISASWGTDETVSGRNAKNVTFQYSMIAEALGISHGFAATIGGTTGSYHHNLLSNCSGRNWSMAGNVDGSGNYITKLDLFNNVCYNWWKRTTDGSAHEVNFVNNVYKMGVDSNKKYLFEMQHQGYGTGTCNAYVNGNIRINKDGSVSEDKLDDTYRVDISPGVVIDYETFVDKPFFPSYATIHSAKDAFKIVLSDNGANMPVFDDHDRRIVDEALNGTWHYVGKPGYKGQIDTEDDCGGFEIYPEQSWPTDFDSDLDGLPNWYEEIVGTNVNSPTDDFSDSNADPDGDGYTLLEDYLEFMAHPHLFVKAGANATLDIKDYFIGFTASPTYTVQNSSDAAMTVNGSVLTVNVLPTAKGIIETQMTVNDSEGSTYTRPLRIAVAEPVVLSVDEIETNPVIDKYAVYTIGGNLVLQGKAHGKQLSSLPLGQLPSGLYILKTVSDKGKVASYRIQK